ncbi:hypothetical protein CLV56_3040 [Mumia flava]|uniref:Uncharacterized protein n=1 Tax=Mumia flava TaxID=1348852 RepID=A0A0B2B9C3_9ACTN|nr:hypothetical protein [Mumia flava]PJJ53550.1 hypothetical protein CLV56_3040 [Mumia flava]
MRQSTVPDLIPVLSPGKHRNARKGACFMEFASYLAGEKWSDQPRCTHPLLAGLARLVNDNVGDDTRSTMVEMVPRVVGLNDPDPRIYPAVCIRTATTALPLSPRAHQRALAVGLLACERWFDDTGTDVPPGMEDLIGNAFAQAPSAEQWARGFRRGLTTHPKHFARRAAPRIVLNSVDGVVRSVSTDSDRVLRGMLNDAIDDCERLISAGTSRPASRVPTS